MLATLVSSTAMAATEKDDWPYPQDIPVSAKLSVGMAGEKPTDISRFLLARGTSRTRINSDGSYIAFISDVTGHRQVWLKSLETGEETQLTFGNGVSSFNWHPNGKQLIYSADNEGDERVAYYLINTSGDKESVVLPHSSAYRVFGNFDETGNKFSYASTERNGLDFDIYLYDFETKSSNMIYQSQFGFFPGNWQPNSKNLVLSQTRGEDANNLYLLNSETGQLDTLYKPEIAASFGPEQWTKDGSGFYVASNVNGEYSQVLFHDIKTGQHKVISRADYDLEGVKLCAQDKYLSWVENNNGFDSLFVKTLGNGQVKKAILPAGQYALDCSKSSSNAIVRLNGYERPAEIYTINWKP